MAGKIELLFLTMVAIATSGCSAINSPDDPVEPSGSGGSTSNVTSTTSTSGGCTTDCPELPNATGECVAGACEYTCEAGFDDCDMDLGQAGSNGCEADLMSDPAHCGACPTMCAAGDLCTTGMCHCEAAPGTAQFNATGTGNIGNLQSFQVPECVVSITIEAFGAQGGAGMDTRGARMKGTFAVQPGQQLTILVGHQADMSQGLSGGGGTFVVDASSNPLIIAGGGGSCFSTCPSAAETVGRIETSGGVGGTVQRADNGQ
ncbi:MAG TPA: hypothetical protein VFB62_27275, partial [Polyangiaceae bacterium]|nr:hypothetical protein [Polyangiaceae bacterium]